MASRSTRRQRTGIAIGAILSLLVAAPAFAQVSVGDVNIVSPNENSFAELTHGWDYSLSNDVTPRGKMIYVATFINSPTLTQRRAAVNSAEFRGAMAQLREAGDFTQITPTFDAIKNFDLFGSKFRMMARFLSCEAEIYFADGKTLAAGDDFAEALQLGERAKSWGILGIDVGIENIALHRIVRHLDQLSAHDCDHLFGILKAVLKAPDPALEGFRVQSARASLEIDDAIRTLTPTHQERDSEGYVQHDKFHPLTDAERQTIVGMRETDPQRLAKYREAALRHLTALYESVTEEYSAYPDVVPSASDDALGAVAPSGSVIDRFVRASSEFNGYHFGTFGSETAALWIERAITSRTLLHLLAVEVAILRWRWEYGSVPVNIDILHLGSIAADPCTGKPLLYVRVDDTHYSLASAGPPVRNPDGVVQANQKRVPLTLEQYR